VWENIGWRELQQQSNDVSGTGGSPGTRPLVAAAHRRAHLGARVVLRHRRAGVEGGLPLQPWAAALKKQRMTDNSRDNPDAHCLPLGNLQLHTHPQPRKMIQAADVLVLLYEGQQRRAADLHRRTAAAGRNAAALVVRLLERARGRRHARASRPPASATVAGSTSTAARSPTAAA
jgi:hypothetical protein